MTMPIYLVIFFSLISLLFSYFTIKSKNKITYSVITCLSLTLILVSSQIDRLEILTLGSGKTKMEAQLYQLSQEQQSIKNQIEIIISLVSALETKPMFLPGENDTMPIRPEIDSLSKLLRETK
jgi:hypothetical protein